MGESDANRPSKKQRELLSFIDGFITGHGYGPSYREIMRALDYKSVSTVAIHVNGLIKKGHLRKRDHSARSLEVVVPSASKSAAVSITKAQQKWLVDIVMTKFDTYEQEHSEKLYDELCVLTGALTILGFEDAARAAKGRLTVAKS